MSNRYNRSKFNYISNQGSKCSYRPQYPPFYPKYNEYGYFSTRQLPQAYSAYYENGYSNQENPQWSKDSQPDTYFNHPNNKQFTQSKQPSYHQDENRQSQNNIQVNSSFKPISSHKVRKVRRKEVNAVSSEKKVNDNCIGEAQVNHFTREEVLRVRVVLKEKEEELIVYRNDDPYQVSKNFIEMTGLSQQLIAPLSIQITASIKKISQVLNEKLSAEQVALLNSVKSLSN